MLFTEFGSDAFNAVTQAEAQKEQADILLKNWTEIYLNAAGMGNNGNCLGGFTFQFADGWWKSGQNVNLDVHDTEASWSNGGYEFDYVKGADNMNEEWFGIGKDKIAHFLMFLPFPILMYMAFHTHHGNPWRLIIFMTVTILIGAAAGAGIELLQMTTKYRSCDILDFRADCIGLLAGSFLVMTYAAVSRKW